MGNYCILSWPVFLFAAYAGDCTLVEITLPGAHPMIIYDICTLLISSKLVWRLEHKYLWVVSWPIFIIVRQLVFKVFEWRIYNRIMSHQEGAERGYELQTVKLPRWLQLRTTKAGQN